MVEASIVFGNLCHDKHHAYRETGSFTTPLRSSLKGTSLKSRIICLFGVNCWGACLHFKDGCKSCCLQRSDRAPVCIQNGQMLGHTAMRNTAWLPVDTHCYWTLRHWTHWHWTQCYHADGPLLILGCWHWKHEASREDTHRRPRQWPRAPMACLPIKRWQMGQGTHLLPFKWFLWLDYCIPRHVNSFTLQFRLKRERRRLPRIVKFQLEEKRLAEQEAVALSF